MQADGPLTEGDLSYNQKAAISAFDIKLPRHFPLCVALSAAFSNSADRVAALEPWRPYISVLYAAMRKLPVCGSGSSGGPLTPDTRFQRDIAVSKAYSTHVLPVKFAVGRIVLFANPSSVTFGTLPKGSSFATGVPVDASKLEYCRYSNGRARYTHWRDPIDGGDDDDDRGRDDENPPAGFCWLNDVRERKDFVVRFIMRGTANLPRSTRRYWARGAYDEYILIPPVRARVISVSQEIYSITCHNTGKKSRGVVVELELLEIPFAYDEPRKIGEVDYTRALNEDKLVKWLGGACSLNAADAIVYSHDLVADGFETVESLHTMDADNWPASIKPGHKKAIQLKLVGANASASGESVSGGGSSHSSGSENVTSTLTSTSSHFTEIPTDDGTLGPITGVMDSPLLDLMTAAAQTGVADVEVHAFMAVEKAEELEADGQLGEVSIDEAAAIALYTAESAFYRTLNQLLRQRDRQALKPFFPYLRLLLTARAKLPKHTASVWRGVKGVDLTGSFPKGKKLFWWAFNSTSKNVSTLLNPMFCGTSGTRTQFMIEAESGIDITRFSMVDAEAEVLLFPGTKLEVVDVANIAPGLFQVHLKEMKLPVQLVK